MEKKIALWNYVVSANKPTAVTHSCVGYFTAPRDRNLIIAKRTRIEIHLVTPQGLLPMLDVPIYGRIVTLQLFRPHGETRDLLFITTEQYRFCVLQWDAASYGVITRATGDLSDQMERPAVYGQMGIINPDCRLIGLHLYDGLFKVILFDNNGQLQEPFNIRLAMFHVLDIKFLYGCPKPTIAVLYQYNETQHVETYEVSLDYKAFTKGPWARYKLDNGAFLLIPVPPPLCGVLIIGEETVVYCSALAFQHVPITPSIKRAYCRIDADRYLLGGLNGLLHRLVITHENEEFTGLGIELLGNTSIASTISYLDTGLVYIGSSCGDSQLVRLNLQPDAEGSYVEVLERYVNLGPIVDFCIVDLEKQGQVQVVTCSGSCKDGSLRMLQNELGIYEQASLEVRGIRGIKGMWSLRSHSFDPYDTFLVVSFISETRTFIIFDKKLEEVDMKGFSSLVQTLFCHNAVCNQLVQITSKSVRSVSSISGELKGEWFPPDGSSISVATANSSQVLLSTGVGNLVYLEIGDAVLMEIKSVKLDYEISCLDINPIGENQYSSKIAAVGMRTDTSVSIYSLPELNLIAKEQLEGDVIPCSALMCSFEGISYLLCALEDGHLLNFVLSMTTGELTDRKKVSLGIQPVTLRRFSSGHAATRVFAASDRPTIIYSSNKKLLYSNVNLKEVGHMCPFNSAGSPSSLALSKEGKLIIGIIDDNQKLHISSIPLQEQACCISHQKQTRTFAICSARYAQLNGNEPEMQFVRLLDDQTFRIISSYSLGQFVQGCSILSCSFSEDSNVYYCVGTVELMPEEIEFTKGQILVFIVEDGNFRLVEEKQTNGGVCSLNAFNGKLLAAANQKIQLYKWVPREDGGYLELQTEYGRHDDLMIARFVQTRGDFIVVGDVMKSVSLLVFKHEEGKIEELARDCNPKYIAAGEILDDEVYLGAENSFNLFTVRKNEGATYEERSRLEVVGRYHLGDFVYVFRHGSLVMRSQDTDMSQIPTTIFGTVDGVIGVIASLPYEQYLLLEKLQTTLRKVIKGVGGLSHEQWRSFHDEERTVDAKNFIDGDLIESFLDLSWYQMEKISTAMAVPVEELINRVGELTKLH